MRIASGNHSTISPGASVPRKGTTMDSALPPPGGQSWRERPSRATCGASGSPSSVTMPTLKDAPLPACAGCPVQQPCRHYIPCQFTLRCQQRTKMGHALDPEDTICFSWNEHLGSRLGKAAASAGFPDVAFPFDQAICSTGSLRPSSTMKLGIMLLMPS